jgi:hypothetical protein
MPMNSYCNTVQCIQNSVIPHLQDAKIHGARLALLALPVPLAGGASRCPLRFQRLGRVTDTSLYFSESGKAAPSTRTAPLSGR